MAGFLISRTIQGLVSFFAVTIVVFALLRMAGDPALLLLPPGAPASEEFLEQTREFYGLNDPLIHQYGRFLIDVLQGDFGVSIGRGTPALEMVLERVAATAQLALASMTLAIVLGSLLGVIAAVYRGTVLDKVSTVAMLFGQSFPNFWLGIMLIILFAVRLQWFPPSGRLSWESMVLPAVTLAAYPMAQVALLVRSGLIDVLRREYITVARSKGLSEATILRRHALKNVAIPVVTLVGLQARSLVGGSIIVETVFAWPGMGLLLIQSIHSRDFPVIQAIVALLAVSVIVINILVDILYAYLDPRVTLVR